MLMDLASLQDRHVHVSRRALGKEMVWLKDPKALAIRVGRLLKLRSEGPAMAAAMVRRAQSEGMECAVAWNRLMSHCMGRGAPLAAFKFYNDVCASI
jgi:hypothetical protein